MKTPLLSIHSPRLPILCLLLAWTAGTVGLLFGLLVAPHWLGRSGSVIVLFALIGEFSLMRGELHRLYLRLAGGNDGMARGADFTPSRWHNKKSVLLHLTIVAGTLIWGFGDLLFETPIARNY